MQPFRYVARASAWLVSAAAGRARPRAAGLLAVAALSFAAVLAGSALLPVLTGSRSTRPVPAARRPQASTAPPVTARAGELGGAPASASPADVRADLARRLGEILRLREQAYARRDATLLDTVYTADCSCLRSGRAAIDRLLADQAVWRGRSISVHVERLSRVDDSLWIALAVLRRTAFWIEREDGELISAEPAARQRYRFALARVGAAGWLLGHASLIEELPA